MRGVALETTYPLCLFSTIHPSLTSVEGEYTESSVKNSVALVIVQARIHALLPLPFQHSSSIGLLNVALFGIAAKLWW